jgi:hypothetical protein
LCGSGHQLLPNQHLLQEVVVLQRSERLVQQVLQDLVRLDLCASLCCSGGLRAELCCSCQDLLCRSL